MGTCVLHCMVSNPQDAFIVCVIIVFMTSTFPPREVLAGFSWKRHSSQRQRDPGGEILPVSNMEKCQSFAYTSCLMWWFVQSASPCCFTVMSFVQIQICTNTNSSPAFWRRWRNNANSTMPTQQMMCHSSVALGVSHSMLGLGAG